MGGRSASLIALCVILWRIDHKRRGVRLDVEALLSVAFRIALDPSFIFPEWAVVLAGVLLARHTERLSPDSRDEVVRQCMLLLRDLEGRPSVSRAVRIAAGALRQEWDCGFRIGLDPVVRCCLREWPDTANARNISPSALDEIVRAMNEVLPGAFTERERRLYRLNLERQGEWAVLGRVRLR
jgi:hypothetical protein